MPIRARTLLMFQEAMLVMRRLYRGGVRFAMPARRCRDGKVPGPRKHKPPFQGRWNGGSRSAFVTLLKEGAWQSGRGNRGKPKSGGRRSEEHTSELQSLMRNSYAVFCLKQKKTTKHPEHN